ncbi:ATP-binding cassette domain-containing protein [Kocuria atrinae]|uniref:ATP-binding cassette domain-containing protein n=1 Tax=Kocuria atrinae TaxID=592377 RepID=UPI0037BF2273
MSLDASTSVRAEEADEAASDSITEPRNHRTQNNTSQALSVRFDNVCRAFPGKNSNEPHVVLKDITLDVVPGEVLAILGPSGSGKSTLLRAASGLDAPHPGNRSDRRNARERNRRSLRRRLPRTAPPPLAEHPQERGARLAAGHSQSRGPGARRETAGIGGAR